MATQNFKVSPGVCPAVSELLSWLPSMDHDSEYTKLVYRFLASLPGGDEAEDIGFEPIEGLGWKELEMFTKLFNAIQDRQDVEAAVHALIRGKEVSCRRKRGDATVTMSVEEEEEG